LRAIDRAKYTALDDALMAVSRAILAAQDGVADLQRQFPYAGDGGTTATIAKLWQATPDTPVMALFANIGDSRLYQWHAHEKRLERLTSDDSRLRQMHVWGEITDDDLAEYTELLDAFTGEEEIARKIRRAACAAWLRNVDGASLLAALRKRTLTTEDRAKIRDLIGQLSSDDFSMREAGSKELFALGRRSLPQLREASADKDVEVARRAKQLIERAVVSEEESTEMTDAVWSRLADAHDESSLRPDRGMRKRRPVRPRRRAAGRADVAEDARATDTCHW